MQRVFASQTTLHKLELFCLVCELQSVTRVADRMRVAQPVVTAHIRFLEEKLGVRLFERSGRRLALTPAGKRVYTWASDVITRTRELERELDLSVDREAGNAIVAASMTVASYVLPPLFATFRRRHPNGGITVQISNPQLVTAAVPVISASAFSILGTMSTGSMSSASGSNNSYWWRPPTVRLWEMSRRRRRSACCHSSLRPATRFAASWRRMACARMAS